jgi:hypothetical protein
MAIWLAAAAPASAPTPTPASSSARDAAELTQLLNEFLLGAGRNDASAHERFWADDLIYTGSAGRRVGKADILADVRSEPPAKPDAPTTVYTAEDVRILQYDETAVIAFRLVATTKTMEREEVSTFLNTGTFRKSDGKWRAVAWQATRAKRDEEAVSREVAAAQAAFDRALATADVATLEGLLDPSFLGTLGPGLPRTGVTILEDLRTGTLKLTPVETDVVNVVAYGNAAVLHGVWKLASSKALLTATYVNDGNGWKIVALHSSAP